MFPCEVPPPKFSSRVIDYTKISKFKFANLAKKTKKLIKYDI